MAGRTVTAPCSGDGREVAVERSGEGVIGAGDTMVRTVELPPPDPSGVCRAAVRFFRPHRTPAAIVTVVLLTAVAAGTATELISTILRRPVLPTEDLARAGRLLRTTAWNDPAVLAIAGGVGLTGLLLLIIALLPGHGRVTVMAASDPRSLLGVGRSGLRATLETAALAVPGIAEARVRLRGRLRRRVVVHAATGYRNPGTLRQIVADAVRARMDAADLVRPPRVVVRLTWRRD
jgi:Family of unknown function (DUF6286)